MIMRNVPNVERPAGILPPSGSVLHPLDYAAMRDGPRVDGNPVQGLLDGVGAAQQASVISVLLS